MANLHDLATTIGNSSLLCLLSALAAGLAAIALMSGSSRVRNSNLPTDFPGDQEAQLDKYVMPFTQLDQVGKDKAEDIAELAEQLKNQPAAHLGLTAFLTFLARKKVENAGHGAKSVPAAPKTARQKNGSPGARVSAPSKAVSDDGDFPPTDDISLPKPTNKKVK